MTHQKHQAAIGDLRHRLTIEQPIRVDDGAGGAARGVAAGDRQAVAQRN